jgi:hypothetical protein
MKTIFNSAFFAKEGEKGLNETSASHLCALASQIKDNNETALKNVCFVNTTMNVVGASGSAMQTESGIDDSELHQIPVSLAGVSRMNAFISWFAEARKNLEAYKSVRTNMDINDWAKEQGIKIPEKPDFDSYLVHVSTLEDVIAQMNIKERQTYLALEAEASTLGKFIHPTQPMDTARKKMHDAITKPYCTMGSGRDTLVYHYSTSCLVSSVDKMFNQLQHKYREIEQSLNHIKSDLRKKLKQINLEEDNLRRLNILEYNKKLDAYNKTMQELTLQYNQWLRDEQTRLSKIKFAIPDSLVDTVQFLNNVDKEK